MAPQTVVNERTQTPSPQPGDGICPTFTQHHDTMAAGYRQWAKSVSEAEKRESTDGFHILDGFLALLEQIPALYAPDSKPFFQHDELFPQSKYAVEWITTADATCERPIRRTYHYLDLGRPRPLVCEVSNNAEDGLFCAGFEKDELKHLPRLVLAWTYVLSARWVEILNAAGEKAVMKQREESTGACFWEMIVERQWQATVTRGDKVFYSPWCLEPSSVSLNVNIVEASLDALCPFRFLQGFCLAEAVTEECATLALAVVLMFPEHREESVELRPVAPQKGTYGPSGVDEKFCKRLYQCLNGCITLSCCDEGIPSLLCSVFFEPSVPCNLIGAHLLGVEKAIEPVQDNPEVFARLMVGRNAKISSMWLAAIWTGQAGGFLASAMGGMPPISVPMASWTGIPQSFIQVGYRSISDRDGFIPRAQEFSTMYLVHPDVRIPFTPSPPFGETAMSETNLDIRMHLSHDHKPVQAMTYWIFGKDELHLAQKQPKIMDRLIVRLPSVARAPVDEDPEIETLEDVVNRISCDATFNLFSWYRSLEGGLWLEEHPGKHEWISHDPEFGEVLKEEEKEGSKPLLDDSHIRSWQEDTALDVTRPTSTT